MFLPQATLSVGGKDDLFKIEPSSETRFWVLERKRLVMSDNPHCWLGRVWGEEPLTCLYFCRYLREIRAKNVVGPPLFVLL